MIDTIIETRPKDSAGGGGKTREELVQEKSREILQKIPSLYKLNEVRESIGKLPAPKPLTGRGFGVPLNIFLFQEIERMQMVIEIVKKTCTDMIDAIDGQIIMTPAIVAAIDSIADAKVPNFWIYDATNAEISWLLPNLGGWVSQLIDRNS